MRLASAFLALLVLAVPPLAQEADDSAWLIVAVLDADGAPIPGASVQVTALGLAAASDAEGVAELEVPPGEAVVLVSAVGYAPASFTITAAPGDEIEGEVVLEEAVAVLGGVETVADAEVAPRGDLEAVGFYARRAEGRGTFLDRDELEARSIYSLHEAVRGASGVSVIRWQEATVAVSSRSVTGSGGMREVTPCPLALFVDGVQVRGERRLFEPPPSPSGQRTQFSNAEKQAEYVDLDRVRVTDLAGVEVYAGTAQTPPQFGQFNPCGAIVVWTRGR